MTQTIYLNANHFDRPRLLARLLAFIGALPLGKSWKIEVSEHKARRSDSQNRYLWSAVYGAFAPHLPGWDKEDIHDYLLGECFGTEAVEHLGRTLIKPLKRSSRLSKAEFAQYADKCIRIADSMGIYVPEPGESDYDEPASRAA